MSDDATFSVRFWGVRGSIPCPGLSHADFGGNTSCLEVRCGPHLFIFDAGSGLRLLGRSLNGHGAIDADIFLTHTHFDHISGIPFFRPGYREENTLRLWAGHLGPRETLRNVVCCLMQAPLFPVPIEVMKAVKICDDFRAGDRFEPRPGVVMRTAPLNHPNGATGYRIEFGGRSICYVTDTEHPDRGRDQQILRLIDRADIFIYDSTYTDEEYPSYRGWGHSTWQEGVRLADEAGVKTFVIHHHDPEHDDAFMNRVAVEAARARPGTLVAREGLILKP